MFVVKREKIQGMTGETPGITDGPPIPKHIETFFGTVCVSYAKIH